MSPKTDTKDSKITKFLIVISDELGNKGKPDIDIKAYNDVMELTDGGWQTITIPLEGTFYFYDWRYPEGQNGSTTQLDFGRISQIEFMPWSGKDDKSGTIYLDNLRLVKEDSNGTNTVQAHNSNNAEIK